MSALANNTAMILGTNACNRSNQESAWRKLQWVKLLLGAPTSHIRVPGTEYWLLLF